MPAVERPRVTGWMGPTEVREIARLATLLGLTDQSVNALSRRLTGRRMDWDRMWLGHAYRIINELCRLCGLAGIDWRARGGE